MSCPISKEDLVAFIYNELDEQKKKIIKQHIKTCAECEKEIASFQKERTILKEWKVDAPNKEFVFVEEKQSVTSWIKAYFPWLSAKPARIGYTFAGIAVLLILILSLINFEFNYDQSGISVNMSIFGKGKEETVDREFLTKLMENQQEAINLVLQAISVSEEKMTQERNIMISQLIQEIQKQRETDMMLIEQNIEYFRSLTVEKFRENDELLGRLVSFAEENLMR
ncbi:MAG: hypothetical protein HWN67_19695 [Candidatus Helarchaeota archaeon]|nr:hypothetical protein [Candidatus Helarchaeota archaeon]